MNYIHLLSAIILCLFVGFVAGQFTDTDSAWFNNLEKPNFYPPGYLFGIVWSILYVMMGVSLYLIIEKTKEKPPFILFGVQLILNFLWTFIFFGMKNIPLAIIEIILLWVLLLWTILNFRKYSKWASYLLIPYIIWVTFATALTLRIYLLN